MPDSLKNKGQALQEQLVKSRVLQEMKFFAYLLAHNSFLKHKSFIFFRTSPYKGREKTSVIKKLNSSEGTTGLSLWLISVKELWLKNSGSDPD